MNPIKATVQNGRVNLKAPADWPEGCAVLIEPLPGSAEKVGLDEDQWSDDLASLADWDAWIKTIEPLEFTPEETASFARFHEDMRRFNVDAVRRQMQQDSP